MQKMLLALVVALGVAGVGRADDKAIVERLEAAGVYVQRSEAVGGVDLAVQLETNDLDTVLPELCELRRLTHVTLHKHGLTDNQLRQVCALQGLTSLYFFDCPITDARMKIVARLRRLQSLDLADSAITDAGLAELTRLSELKWLVVRKASVTDAGLGHLEGLHRLTWLDLRGCTQVTAEGVARLQKSLPECSILH
jgi:hypothetical protein